MLDAKIVQHLCYVLWTTHFQVLGMHLSYIRLQRKGRLEYPMAVFFGISVPVAGITGQQVLEGMGQGSGAQFRFDEQVYGMANSDAPLAHGL